MSKLTNMPANLREIHDKLRRELVLLYTKWNAFKTLYCTSDESVRMLDSAAALFFQMCRELLRDDIILTVCRLTDPAKSRVGKVEKSNLTIEYLVELIPPNEEILQRSLRSMLPTIEVRCEPFRKHRNSRIGHCDVETRRKRAASLLPEISVEHADETLHYIAEVLNAVERHYDNNEHPYRDGVYGSGNAEELLEFIRRKKDLEDYFNRKEFGN
jgi:hypothetical protein